MILNGVHGFARPKEVLAIMGPSGSGKTSLLNALSCRIGVSPGSILSGNIVANGREVKANNFGSYGAFVQQDDILMSTMTPKECFTFAAKLR